MYAAYTKRKIADELSMRRSMEMAALWGNMNYDSKENPEARQMLSDAIDKRYSAVIAHLYGEPIQQEVEVDTDDPFWQAMERGLEKHRLGNSG